ncbi:hypothetical protein ABFX02_01G049700 [Erythranthe guttata]
MASAIGPSATETIQNHPYRPNARIEIPNEIQHDKSLVKMWPQIEQQVLEFRKMAYLIANLLREYAQELSLNLPEKRALIETTLRSNEQIWPDEPLLQRAKTWAEFTTQHAVNSIQLADAYVEQITAYAQENSDLASMGI